ncbi:MAG TPA: hypothetical protein VGN41_26140 [Streptosporangiaceae bacterium]
MPENETILYRGARYEIGRGPGFYGIWPADAPRPDSIEWWPETPEGWHGAWSRFTAIETPGTIVPVGEMAAGQPGAGFPGPGFPGAGQPGAGQPGAWLPGAGFPGARRAGAALAGASRGAVVAAALLAAGVVLGIASLFPAYLDGASLAQQPPQLVPHVIYLAAWTGTAALILLGGARGRAGALLGLGTSIVTFGFFFTDAGTPIAGGAHLMGVGLVLGLVGWAACAAGSGLAFRLRPARASGAPVPPRWRDRRSVLPLAGAAIAAVGAAVTFAPSWDSYVLRTAAGTVQTATAGNAFANPGPVIAGSIAVMAALVLVVVAAVQWRPARLGAALLVGAVVPMAAQAISALVQVGEGTSPAQLGISPAQAAQAGLTISSGLTAAFWLYCVFIVGLIVAGAWMAIPRRPAAVAPPTPVATIVS